MDILRCLSELVVKNEKAPKRPDLPIFVNPSSAGGDGDGGDLWPISCG